eukprot:scaffold44398_cov19-Tisochrysis_lutea.AAC.3
MAAASSVPVPSGLVSTNACPDRRPPLDITPASATSPVTLKPRASSGPSQVWPPTNAHPDSLRTCEFGMDDEGRCVVLCCKERIFHRPGHMLERHLAAWCNTWHQKLARPFGYEDRETLPAASISG